MINISILILFNWCYLSYAIPYAVHLLVQFAVDPRLLSKLLQIEQKNVIYIQELVTGQSRIEAKLDAQRDQLEAILNKLSGEELETWTKGSSKGKKTKSSEEFYQVNMPILVYIVF